MDLNKFIGIGKNLLILILMIYSFQLSGQTLYGKINDSDGTPLAGAIIKLSSSSGISTFSNENGLYKLSNLPCGPLTVTVQMIGYKNRAENFVIKSGDSILYNFILMTKALVLKDFEITNDRLSTSSSVSSVELNQETISKTQGLFEDPIRVIATIPGISRGGDLFSPSEIYVRGGSPSENLFMLNNARVYFPFYFGGQKSIFNTDVIDKVEVLTGGFPVKYGNAMSSVLNVTTRDGNRDMLHGSASIGFYNMAAMLEGPLTKKMSFIVAVRRTYLDLFLKNNASFPVPGFGDITYKLSYLLNDKNKLTFSGLAGDEHINYLTLKPQPGQADKIFTKGNSNNESMQWQYGSEKVYSKLSLLSTHQFSDVAAGRNFSLNINGLDFALREDFAYILSEKFKLQSGIELTRSYINSTSGSPFDPRVINPIDSTVKLLNVSVDHSSYTASSYLSLEGNLTKKLVFNIGLREDYLNLNKNINIAPRISIHYLLSSTNDFRAAYSYNYQFPDIAALMQKSSLVSNLCTHYILSYSHKFTPGIYGRIEAYDKEYSHLVVYDSLYTYSNKGYGYARGLEVFIQKHNGMFKGWLSYALSVSRRLSDLDEYIHYFDYDQRHILNFVAEISFLEKNYKSSIPKLITASIRYETGKPYTPITGAIYSSSVWQPVKGGVNAERDPYYLNVNLHIEWQFRTSGRAKIISYIEVWNLLNKKNILGRAYQYGANYPNHVLVQPYYSTTLLPAGGVKVIF